MRWEGLIIIISLSRHIFLAVLLACTLLSCPSLFSQCPYAPLTPKDLQSERSEFAGAENRWQTAAVDVESQADTVAPDIRAKRNAYLKPLLEGALEARCPKDLPPGAGVIVFDGAVLGGAPELPAIPHAVWVIAKFESFHVFASDPGNQLIHTEVNFRVTQVLRKPPSLSLTPGALLDSEIAGGRIKKPDGSFASFAVRPERHSYQPGGTYLLQGTYDPTTEYFRMNKWWDLSSGKVVPGLLLEIDRAAKGTSKLSGLTIVEAIQYLDSVLPWDFE